MKSATGKKPDFHFKADQLTIIFDDLDSHIGYFMGISKHVSADHINFMITTGRGLVYTCMTEEMSKQLDLDFMAESSPDCSGKDFAVSVDYKTTTTGISAFERAETIKALADPQANPDDFRRPGHIFPLVSKANGLLDRIGIAEAAVELAGWKANDPAAYLCEILDSAGQVAAEQEIRQLSERHGLSLINMSEILQYRLECTNWLEIAERRELEISNQSLTVYQIHNLLYPAQYTVYLSDGRFEDKPKALYRECRWGDQLDLQDQCNCPKHFKDYLEELLNGQLSGITYEQSSQMDTVPAHQRKAILNQIHAFIDQENTRKKNKSQSVPNAFSA